MVLQPLQPFEYTRRRVSEIEPSRLIGRAISAQVSQSSQELARFCVQRRQAIGKPNTHPHPHSNSEFAVDCDEGDIL